MRRVLVHHHGPSMALVLIVAVGCVLLTYDLRANPSPWFDEGLNMGAAASVARSGIYGLPDRFGENRFDPAIQTGPTVIIPLAITFSLTGPSVMAARALVACASILALLGFIRLACTLWGPSSAAWASGLLLVAGLEPWASLAFLGRQVLGESAAFGLLMLGALALARSLEDGHKAWVVAAALLWSAAALTKLQVLPAMFGGIGGALAYPAWRRRERLALLGVVGLFPVIALLAWHALQFLLSGQTTAERADVLLHGGTSHLLSISPAHTRNALGVIWRSGFLVWGLPGLVYGAHRVYRGRAHPVEALLLLGCLASLLWFVGLSIGWSRYAFFPFSLVVLWSGHLMHELAWRPVRLTTHRAAVGLLAGAVFLAGTWAAHHRHRPTQPSGFEEVRAYVRDHLDARDVVLTADAQISFDMRDRFVHVPIAVINPIAVFKSGRGLAMRPGPYDLPEGVSHVVVGPFGGWTGLFGGLLGPAAVPRFRAGEYAVYELMPPRPPDRAVAARRLGPA